MDHICDNLGHELLVVRHEHDRTLAEAGHVLGEPRDRCHVEMIGGLVEQQDVGALQHGACDRELHAPATREVGHGRVLHLTGEAHRVQGRADALATLLGELSHHEVVHGLAGVAVPPVHLVLHVDALEVRGEVMDVALSHAGHESSLAHAVLPHKAVHVPAVHVQVRALEQHAGCEREDDAVEVDDTIVMRHLHAGVLQVLGGHVAAQLLERPVLPLLEPQELEAPAQASHHEILSVRVGHFL
mmetsp:Transcript_644/g.2136  ORF Transcript_644/g.2136 Transcript_644/m.2136 type:complete len:243 (-) Transcript_644:1786-2514(-)